MGALHAADPAARRAAARALAGRPEHAAALCARLPEEPDPATRESILNALIQIGTDEAFEGLVAHLRHQDAWLRSLALEALQRMPGPAARHVSALLEHPDPDVRIGATLVVRHLRHPRALDLLLQVISRDAHPNVCASAVDGLVELVNERMRPALQQLRERFPGDPFLSFTVEQALSELDRVDDHER